MSNLDLLPGIDPSQLLQYVIRPTLERFKFISFNHLTGFHPLSPISVSIPIERLILGTAAKESNFQYIHQLGSGPALSLWQIEPFTARDAINRFCSHFGPSAFQSITGYYPQSKSDPGHPYVISIDDLIARLAGDIYLSCSLCRMVYYYKPFNVSELGNGEVSNLAHVWKKYYNTVKGKGTEQEFIDAWKRFALEKLYG